MHKPIEQVTSERMVYAILAELAEHGAVPSVSKRGGLRVRGATKVPKGTMRRARALSIELVTHLMGR